MLAIEGSKVAGMPITTTDGDGLGEHRLIRPQNRNADGLRRALDRGAEGRAGEQNRLGAARQRVAAQRIEASENPVGQLRGEGTVAAQQIVEQVDEIGLRPCLGEGVLDGPDSGRRGVDESDAYHII